jgi:hypothetical protein
VNEVLELLLQGLFHGGLDLVGDFLDPFCVGFVALVGEIAGMALQLEELGLDMADQGDLLDVFREQVDFVTDEDETAVADSGHRDEDCEDGGEAGENFCPYFDISEELGQSRDFGGFGIGLDGVR